MSDDAPRPQNDERYDESLDYPPGLVSDEEAYGTIEHGDWIGVYVEGEQATTILKSDTMMEVQQ
jgi:hypothetical protein